MNNLTLCLFLIYTVSKFLYMFLNSEYLCSLNMIFGKLEFLNLISSGASLSLCFHLRTSAKFSFLEGNKSVWL